MLFLIVNQIVGIFKFKLVHSFVLVFFLLVKKNLNFFILIRFYLLNLNQNKFRVIFMRGFDLLDNFNSEKNLQKIK